MILRGEKRVGVALLGRGFTLWGRSLFWCGLGGAGKDLGGIWGRIWGNLGALGSVLGGLKGEGGALARGWVFTFEGRGLKIWAEFGPFRVPKILSGVGRGSEWVRLNFRVGKSHCGARFGCKRPRFWGGVGVSLTCARWAQPAKPRPLRPPEPRLPGPDPAEPPCAEPRLTCAGLTCGAWPRGRGCPGAARGRGLRQQRQSLVGQDPAGGRGHS